MLILVTANNFVVMVVGWEGVGFCSYLLINFWFTRIQANKSAIKAVICNRVGDFFLLLGIIGILIYFGSTDYNVVFASIEHFATYKDFGINGSDSLYWLGSDYKYTTEDGISKETFLLYYFLVVVLVNQHKWVYILDYQTLWKVQLLYLHYYMPLQW